MCPEEHLSQSAPPIENWQQNIVNNCVKTGTQEMNKGSTEN